MFVCACMNACLCVNVYEQLEGAITFSENGNDNLKMKYIIIKANIQFWSDQAS
jgi:hypothetical protein